MGVKGAIDLLRQLQAIGHYMRVAHTPYICGALSLPPFHGVASVVESAVGGDPSLGRRPQRAGSLQGGFGLQLDAGAGDRRREA